MHDNDRHLDKLVKAQDEIDPQRRESEQERRQKTNGDRIDPHRHDVHFQTEPDIAACAEHTADDHRIDRLAHDVVRCDQQHDAERERVCSALCK